MILKTSAQNQGRLLSGIQILNKQRRIKINRAYAAEFCATLLNALGSVDCAISVVFVSPRQMRVVNYRYLKRNYATDVLSFAYEGVMTEGAPFLGEMLIAPEVAIGAAGRYGVNPEKEIRKLLVHGILHLLGYDHETDCGQMQGIQSRLMRREFFMKSPSILKLMAKQ
jgi:probable rRNA maturation factor